MFAGMKKRAQGGEKEKGEDGEAGVGKMGTGAARLRALTKKMAAKKQEARQLAFFNLGDAAKTEILGIYNTHYLPHATGTGEVQALAKSLIELGIGGLFVSESVRQRHFAASWQISKRREKPMPIEIFGIEMLEEAKSHLRKFRESRARALFENEVDQAEFKEIQKNGLPDTTQLVSRVFHNLHQKVASTASVFNPGARGGGAAAGAERTISAKTALFLLWKDSYGYKYELPPEKQVVEVLRRHVVEDYLSKKRGQRATMMSRETKMIVAGRSSGGTTQAGGASSSESSGEGNNLWGTSCSNFGTSDDDGSSGGSSVSSSTRIARAMVVMGQQRAATMSKKPRKMKAFDVVRDGSIDLAGFERTLAEVLEIANRLMIEKRGALEKEHGLLKMSTQDSARALFREDLCGGSNLGICASLGIEDENVGPAGRVAAISIGLGRAMSIVGHIVGLQEIHDDDRGPAARMAAQGPLRCSTANVKEVQTGIPTSPSRISMNIENSKAIQAACNAAKAIPVTPTGELLARHSGLGNSPTSMRQNNTTTTKSRVVSESIDYWMDIGDGVQYFA